MHKCTHTHTHANDLFLTCCRDCPPSSFLLPLPSRLLLPPSSCHTSSLPGREEEEARRRKEEEGGGRRRKEEEEEEEGLFKADAVNEEDPERGRATQV